MCDDLTEVPAMRMIFGFVGILIVLAIVASLAKTPFALFSGSSPSATRAMDAGGDVDAAGTARNAATPAGRSDGALDLQRQSIDLQNQVRERVNQNLQKGVDRSADAAQQ
jgi:hypothetical protein